MMHKKNLFFIAWLFIWTALPLSAQLMEPVQFSVKQQRTGEAELTLTFRGSIADGWHVYSTEIGEGGPTEATLHVENLKGLEKIGKLQPEGKVKEVTDPVFGMKVKYFEGTATFVQKFQITAKDYSAKGYLEYGACDDKNCIPPTQVDFSIDGKDGPEAPTDEKGAKTMEETTISVPIAIVADSIDADSTATSEATSDWWTPVKAELNSFGQEAPQGKSLWGIFLLGLLGGLIALVTPCVWPVIPMTVSFFLHRADDKRRALKDALLYGLSIVVIYVGAGLLVTLIWGASGLNSLSTNAVFNLICFAVLIILAASFLGGFELTLPNSWNNRVNNKAESTAGIVSIFLMALTLVLVSFSCTGPIVGFLLVDATTGSLLSPTVGMLGFAIALAIPFMLFALFPTWMKKMPKSGGWMNTIKVVLGFIEIAFALKFLSVADMAYGWHLLDRETFLALWIVIFALLGIYLLGKIRFPGDDDTPTTSVPRFFLALISLAFAVYMVPGLWGAPLKAISAFSPPMKTQDFNLYKSASVEAEFNDYNDAIAAAKERNKPLLIDFTGYGCVNCRKMEQSVWSDPNVKELWDKYVTVSLYVDDRTPLSTPRSIEENGRQRTLRTQGDLWSFLQRHKFGTNAQPFYVLLDENGQPLNKAYTFDEDADHFVMFLETGWKNFTEK